MAKVTFVPPQPTPGTYVIEATEDELVRWVALSYLHEAGFPSLYGSVDIPIRDKALSLLGQRNRGLRVTI